ncbi:UDP-N-acetylmuramate--L-alanine ligase [Capnocytophaga felis]|uniref:UDP-N-acetylmuramate--L-alanine ligase n=1 Tax=Capnocytophaga felis TaxID=2267611 RepID=A0A5M4BAS2_9FLAO|nr:UDP-N-acetylmuramate--L-alanine ligase [Capnocytophaga felis]GET48790.1 UDP-N-acetylmuramate--L-alanine ligase [Capnocytophaga felis]
MKINFNNIQNVYFIGIGGIGMSALARYFKAIGKNVCGYDRTPTEITDTLESEGIKVHFTEDEANIPTHFKNTEKTLVIYTPAVPKEHAELIFFQKNGYQVFKRSEILGMITENSFCLAVAGTHGKTTTSSILTHILVESGASVSAFLGGIAENFNSNLVLHGSEFTVVEADEFDRSFLRLSPDIACITSMDADHLDIYGNKEEFEKGFRDFADKIKSDENRIICNGLKINGKTYGLEDNSDFSFQNIRIENGMYHFDFHYTNNVLKDYVFPKPGRHNLSNALAAVAMGVRAGFPAEKLLSALATFKGVKRRFSYIIKEKDFVFIDDYAHHPSEINALFQAVDEMYPKIKKTIVFQPHLFTRTRDFMDEFAESLSKFDNVILLDIYPARELPIEEISSEKLLEKIRSKQKTLVSKENLIPLLKEKQPKLLLSVGAGDIGAEVERIKKSFL